MLCSALSAYMFYANAKRDEVKKENPEVTFGEVGGAGAGWEGGARWRVCGGGARSLVAAQAWGMQYRESHLHLASCMWPRLMGVLVRCPCSTWAGRKAHRGSSTAERPLHPFGYPLADGRHLFLLRSAAGCRWARSWGRSGRS